ncbi:MAG TPA: methyltransferase [Intrasporangiaceae bacterium]|nr:methyltransferase [Intrasporangiaceae bacterium]
MRTSLPVVDADLLALLRTDLIAARFTVPGIAEVLGPMAGAALAREHPLPAERVTDSSTDPCAALIRLFTLGAPVDVREVQAALPNVGVDGITTLGLVRHEGDAVVATCDLRPYATERDTWWVASDLDELATGEPLRPDHVLGIGGASTTLASWTPRCPVDRALDVGTGSGVQALHLSRDASQVVVSDLSERALAYAAFNAALNGVTWDIRRGSMLEPVAGETFDLIVSNPPFVITPRDGSVPLFEYRDGGAAGDAVVADLVAGLGAHLVPGGVAQLLGNWEIARDADWRDRVGAWVADSGLDAWVVQREVQDPAQYAETWARDGGHHAGTAQFRAMYASWLDDFASRDVEGVGFGIITLHKPSTDREPFVDLMDVRGPVAAVMGPTIAAGLAARERLATLSDEDLLDVAWAAAADVTVEHHLVPGSSQPRAVSVVQGGGLRLRVPLDSYAAGYVGVADGSITPRQALVAVAAILEEDAAEVTARVVPMLRYLIANGFLID